MRRSLTAAERRGDELWHRYSTNPTNGVFVPSHTKPDIVTRRLRITDGQLAYVSGGTGVVPQRPNLYGGTQLLHLRYVKLVVVGGCVARK